jgi:hypothetical protein
MGAARETTPFKGVILLIRLIDFRFGERHTQQCYSIFLEFRFALFETLGSTISPESLSMPIGGML